MSAAVCLGACIVLLGGAYAIVLFYAFTSPKASHGWDDND